ncbi:peptidase T [Algivirga pacifica]|uniref:Peptidase T n=1 Tax=Algivirga pacifica TaxID=1162670 RepID=A0ABP9D200_9BACT
MEEIKEDIIERFTRYVQYDTEAIPGVETIPSSPNQHILAKDLAEELKAIGMEEVTVDEHAYVMATLPANTDKELPTIGFVAHIDTTPDFTGKDVKPQIWKNYNGGEIPLNKEQGITLSAVDFPFLKEYIGDTLITSDGTTLLGADDKAGVTEIVTAMDYLIKHPEIKHGKIRICFTPDEEVGKGADLFDVEKFGAEWAYTMDGGPLGELEFDNFNAAYAKLDFYGHNVHPGTAKGIMKNSMSWAAAFVNELPSDEVPEQTTGYEGFYHLLSMNGEVEHTTLEYIIRDHDREKFEEKKRLMEYIAKKFKSKYGEEAVTLHIEDQYYNMKEKIAPVMHIVDLAESAMSELGIPVDIKPIRGGTDGAKLSYMGLPCPNIFAGGRNMHSRYEFVSVETMQKAVAVIVKIAELMGRESE